jgi:hypothetical protein
MVKLANDGPSAVWLAGRRGKGDGWDGKAHNDNDYWPLLKALRADGELELIETAVRYRECERAAESANLLEGFVTSDSVHQLDKRTWVNRKGELVYKGERRLTAAPFGPAPTLHNGRVMNGEWTGDLRIIARLDALPVLSRLRLALGPLVQPVEAAVVYGQSLEAVGRREGFNNKASASAAGKALVYRGLHAARGLFSAIKLNEVPPAVR